MVDCRSLHIVRRRLDGLAVAVIAAQRRDRTVEVVLVQDGVFAQLPAETVVCVNDEDVTARGVDTSYRRVGYEHIAAMICGAERVTVW